VEEEEKISLKVVKLYQNVPNPMRNWTQIKYYIPKKGKVEFKIYDITGRIVVSFSTQKVSKGEHFIQWERKDKNGTPLPSGIYFYQLKFENQTITKKMVLL
jgi:flagellar hook assembly protein FlgD